VSEGTAVRGLLEGLAAAGADEGRALIEQARLEAARIDEDSASRMRDELDRRKAVRALEIAGRESVMRMEARGGARRSALGARQLLVDRVFERATTLLPDLATPEWLEGEVGRVLPYLPDGEVTITCRTRDVARVKRLVAKRADVSVRADDAILAGVIAELGDGSLVVNGTAEARLARMRSMLAIEIVKMLEGAS
jgi:vacuolar-type H+-ATPase subunit E/Vma4